MMLRVACVAFVLTLSLAAVQAAARDDWTELDEKPSPDEKISFRISIQHSAELVASLEDTCTTASDPTSPKYGKYLSFPEYIEALANDDLPTRAGVVEGWLVANGADEVISSPARDFLKVKMPVQAVERLLLNQGVDIPLVRYENADARVVRLSGLSRRKSQYLTPKHLFPPSVAKHVQAVLGLMDLPVLQHRRGWKERVEETLRQPVDDEHAPRILMQLMGLTKASLVFLQPCTDGSIANTSIPCVNTSDPVVNYTFRAYALGDPTPVEVPLVMPNKNIRMHSVQGHTTYILMAPVPLQPFTKYRFMLQAVSQSGATSAWAGLYFDSSVPKDETYLITTPLVTPTFLRSFYNVSSYDAPAGVNNSQAVAEFFQQTYSSVDMDSWIAQNDPQIDPSLVRVLGTGAGVGQVESMMDTEWIMAMSPRTETFFWYVANGFLMEWAMAIASNPHPPLVHSLSYGANEVDIDWTSANTELMKICARGLTVMASSGDGGATSKGHGNTQCTMTSSFPACSPWVTAVGASMVSDQALPRKDMTLGEVACSIPNGLVWTTGGGFTNHSRPAYQEAAVATYLQDTSIPFPKAGAWNSSGRGFPDVAAIGHNVVITAFGATFTSGGTSASSPIFAGMVSLLNAYRLGAGKAPLGFINPLLYHIYQTHPQVFYDIVDGGNACGQSTCCEGMGFQATKGWDPVSGLGTINDFELLKTLVLELP